MNTTIDHRDLVSGKTLARIGLALLLLGLVFLYRWGVEQNYITEIARVGMGVAISLSLLGIGWATRTRQALFGALLQGGGVAGLYVTAFAAHARYGLTEPVEVFIQLVFVSALGFGLAVHEKIETLAIVGAVGAIVAPMMVPGTIDFFPGDAGYIAIVLLAVGAILYRFDWKVLFASTAALAGGSLLIELSGVLGEWDFTANEALVAYGAVLLSLWAAPILRAAIIRDQNAAVAMTAAAAIPVASFVGAWAAAGNPIAAEWGVGALVMAALMGATYVQLHEREPFLANLHLYPAAVFAVAAAGLMLDGPSLAFAVAAQGVAFVIIGRRLALDTYEIFGWMLYSAVGVHTAAGMIGTVSGDVPVWNGTSLSRLGVVVLAPALGYVLQRDQVAPEIWKVLYGIGHVGLLIWSLAELSRTEIGHPIASAFWGTYALAIISGAWSKSRLARNIGIATMLATVVKVFVVDLANASGGAKILLLMGFGLVLLALGYLMPTQEPEEESLDFPPPSPDDRVLTNA